MKFTELILPVIVAILVGLFVTILTRLSDHISTVEKRQLHNALYIYKIEQNHKRITKLERILMVSPVLDDDNEK